MNTSDIKSDFVIKRQPASKKREPREEQRMKEEDQSNADTYRFINTSPPKMQLTAAIIHTEKKKIKNKRNNIKVK